MRPAHTRRNCPGRLAGIAGIAGLLLLVSGAGCHTMSNSAKGTLLGGGVGGIAGAIVGNQLGHRDAGALLGALAGGATGALAGHEMDVRNERDAAVRYSDHLEQAIATDGSALTNYDLARLTASGASDEVIVAAVRSHGGKFDLSPDGLIQLKALGVSDRVILAVQQNAAPPTLTTVPAVTPAGYQVPAPAASHTPSRKRRPWWRAVPKDGPPSESKWW